MSPEHLDDTEIIHELRQHKARLSELKVERIGLFGSYADGNQEIGSDIDFLVKFSQIGFDNYMELKFFLEDLFEKDVDLVVEDDLKPSLQYVRDEAKYVATA